MFLCGAIGSSLLFPNYASGIAVLMLLLWWSACQKFEIDFEDDFLSEPPTRKFEKIMVNNLRRKNDGMDISEDDISQIQQPEQTIPQRTSACRR